MVALEVLLTLLRELLRALTTPLRLAAYLPRRHHWRAVAREVLDAAAHEPPLATEAALHEFFARRRPDRGALPHLFVSAGEASGEGHAARLVRALTPGPRVTAFGGPPLAAAGAELRFPLSEHAVMGVAGVLRQLPLIVRAFASYLRLLRDDPPDLVLLVDYPGLHVVMAKAARRRRIPVLHYVAPQYWAWGPWRMRRYRRAVDATLTILPFETAFFRRCRVPAVYIGHPLLDELVQQPPDPDAVAAVRRRRTLVLLPGSRRAEITANLPGMLRIADGLRRLDPDLRCVVPHTDPRRTPLVQELLQAHGAQDVEHHAGDLGPWLQGAHLIVAKSGTGSLAACLSGNPVVVVYRLRSLLATLGYHNVLSVPWVAAANLVAGRAIVPEHVFHGEAGWQRVLADAERLWQDAAARAAAQTGLAEVRQRLGAPGATARTAAIVRRFLAGATPP
ncbi:MAG: lipid-A-disaccharide synthase [Planctomycetes bacterium]|nr:lipid-A-disaccharide synthase [Planctomycetota bacterium]